MLILWRAPPLDGTLIYIYYMKLKTASGRDWLRGHEIMISFQRRRSLCGRIHEFITYAMSQQARTDNLTIFVSQKTNDVSFACVRPIIDNQNFVIALSK